MGGLLDVNVLVALVLPTHIHHDDAQRWMESDGEPHGWATCPLTELGAIRVCAQLPPHSAPRATADTLLALRLTIRGHVWWPDAVSPTLMHEVRTADTPKQVTDAYLLGLARRYGGRVVTFDRGLKMIGGDDVLRLLPSNSKN